MTYHCSNNIWIWQVSFGIWLVLIRSLSFSNNPQGINTRSIVISQLHQWLTIKNNISDQITNFITMLSECVVVGGPWNLVGPIWWLRCSPRYHIRFIVISQFHQWPTIRNSISHIIRSTLSLHAVSVEYDKKTLESACSYQVTQVFPKVSY